MKMKDFAQVIKKSKIAGNNVNKIIYNLLQALGAKEAISEAAMNGEEKVSDQSPSDSTIQKWLNEKSGKPRVSSYFPNLKVENEESAHNFLRNTTQEDQWKRLRDLFAEWRKENQNDEGFFYINTETDDFITFSISFWRQFVSYFESLRMWDGANNERESEIEEPETEDSKNRIAHEMGDIFKENFIQYKLYEFIPKDIDAIIASLGIYSEILNENSKFATDEDANSDYKPTQNFKKMYCKWFPDHMFFELCTATYRECFWELKTTEEYRILRFDENFDFEKMPTNTWLAGKFKYAISNTDFWKGAQFDSGILTWKQCPGEIIIINIDSQTVDDYPIINDCHMIIGGMLELSSLVDQFIETIDMKIINRYTDIILDDNSKWIYNNIKEFKISLDGFKKNLIAFDSLKKEKSQYFADLATKDMFSAYKAFAGFEVSPKPHYPFSELYLNPEEADEVKFKLHLHHKNLMELYTQIISYGKCP